MPIERLKLETYAYNPIKRRPLRLESKSEKSDSLAQGGTTTVGLNNNLTWAAGRQAEDIFYPRTAEERASFKLENGKRIPPHHWAVYDYILAIPEGKVTTYKEVSLSVGGSPRSVGNALRTNPFMPYIPCHRVIASDLTLGGYFGEWGKTHKTGNRFHQKIDILTREGVMFTEYGKLASPAQAIWKYS